LEPTLQAFEFGGLYVCTTFSYDDIFPYDDVIIMWIKEKAQGFFGLKPWIMDAKCSLA